MQYPALTLIHEEHQALGCVLRALRDSVDAARKSAHPPDFELLRAMLFYMDEMPARIHHAVEEELLFPRIRERCPALRPVLDRLEAEHGRAEIAVRDLERSLTAWEVVGDDCREAFDVLMRGYVQGYLGQMEVEENYVLAVAKDYLSESDWHALQLAFVRQRAKVTDSTVQAHRGLLARIHSRQHLVHSPCRPSTCQS